MQVKTTKSLLRKLLSMFCEMQAAAGNLKLALLLPLIYPSYQNRHGICL